MLSIPTNPWEKAEEAADKLVAEIRATDDRKALGLFLYFIFLRIGSVLLSPKELRDQQMRVVKALQYRLKELED